MFWERENISQPKSPFSITKYSTQIMPNLNPKFILQYKQQKHRFHYKNVVITNSQFIAFSMDLFSVALLKS